MRYKPDGKDFIKVRQFSLFLATFIFIFSLLIFFIAPAKKIIPFYIPVTKAENVSDDAEFEIYLQDKQVVSYKGDEGLLLYRQPHYRLAIEDFYFTETNNREITLAILEYADKNDIPLSLAFSLAYAESRYKVRAINYNTNGSIDRGLFQLNDRSFPQLTEEDFFNPIISARHGMSHLRYCMNISGNMISALAMYNAGANRVRSNSTPQITLNYIGNIVNHMRIIDKRFSEEVLAYIDYENQGGKKN